MKLQILRNDSVLYLNRIENDFYNKLIIISVEINLPQNIGEFNSEEKQIWRSKKPSKNVLLGNHLETS